MLYDVRSERSALETLERMTGIFREEWGRGELPENDGVYPEDFVVAMLKGHSGVEAVLEPCDLRVRFFHATSSANRCASIRREGLVDLQRSISMPESELGQFLQAHGLRFDVDRRILSVDGRSYDLGWWRNCSRPFGGDAQALWDAGYRLYRDHAVCGFFSPQDITRYGTPVDRLPEVLLDLDALLGTNMAEEWSDSHYSYVVVAEVPATEVCVPINGRVGLSDWYEEYAIKAYLRAYGYPDRDVVVLHDGVRVPPSHITRVMEND